MGRWTLGFGSQTRWRFLLDLPMDIYRFVDIIPISFIESSVLFPVFFPAIFLAVFLAISLLPSRSLPPSRSLHHRAKPNARHLYSQSVESRQRTNNTYAITRGLNSKLRWLRVLFE